MLRTTFILFMYLAFLGLGLGAPFIITLGYVWVDLIRPQNISWGILASVPVSMLMGIAAVGAYILLDRRSPPRIGLVPCLLALLSIWVTLTCLWAEVPNAAWEKWDWAAKSVLFTAFIPLVIRSRNQIEAFLQVFVFSLAANVVPYGAKVLLSGGGYGMDYGLMGGNTYFGEGGTISAAALAAIPLMLFLRKHATLIPLNRWTKLGYLGLVILAAATALGTHERSALVGAVVLAAVLWVQARRKIFFAAGIAAVAYLMISVVSANWTERMSTIETYQQDTSAYGRILVWKWTLGYVAEHPLGGGFDAYRINRIEYPPDANGNVQVQNARAYHSIYFEVLGEHGWIGFGLFAAILLSTLGSLRRLRRLARVRPHLAWAGDLSHALQASLLTLLTCGLFVGFGFQPFLYYAIILPFCLREFVARVESAPQERLLPDLRPARAV